jgi:endonuclease YncB( thermonuclease family)
MPDPVTSPTPGERFWYTAEVLRVVDGDTVQVRLSLGCDTFRRETLRVYGINAPESKGATAVAGKAARDFLNSLLGLGGPVLVHTILDKNEKFGRLLAHVFLPDLAKSTAAAPVWNPVTVSQQMIAAGHAVPYLGGKRE